MFDIYLLEAAINGILLGGVLALLALGLNLIFGVIDVVWICYAELIMMGMYGMFYLVSVFHLPFIVAAVMEWGGHGGTEAAPMVKEAFRELQLHNYLPHTDVP